MSDISSRPPMASTQPTRSMSSSDNSHASDSAGSQPGSNRTSNTSSWTHSSSITPLPRGAKPPQVNPKMEHDRGFNTNAKRKARVLRKAHPPPSINNASNRNGNLFSIVHRRSTSSYRASVNFKDDTFFPGTGHRRSLPLIPSYVSSHPRSLDDRYESQPTGRPLPPAEHAAHAFGTFTRSTDVKHSRMNVDHVAKNDMSHAITQINSQTRTLIVMGSPANREKPLPNLPAPPLDGLASSRPPEPIPSPRLPRFPYTSLHSPSEDGRQIVPLFDHCIPSPQVHDSLGVSRRYTRSKSEVGHTQAWSESHYSVSGTQYGCSDTHYNISEPQCRHNPHLLSNHSRSLSTTPRPASWFHRSTTPSRLPHPTHSTTLYTSNPRILHPQEPPGLTRGLSWGKRIMRRLSVTLFRQDPVVDEPIQDLPYLASDSGHSTFHQPGSVTHSFVPSMQHRPQDGHARNNSRKLKKRPPSLSHSHWSKPPILTSMSSPALYSHPRKSREALFELGDTPSQNLHSEFENTTPPSSLTKKRFKSNFPRYVTDNKSMTRHSRLSTSTPALNATRIPSQPTSPPFSSAKKLVKRHTRRKLAQSAVDGHTLPPLRAQSPVNLNFNSHDFSDMPRWRSEPNLGPTNSGSEPFPSSRFIAFSTDSHSESSHFADSPVGQRPLSEPHQDLPSPLHSGSSRRWTLAVFDAPEEQLVEELDRLRDVGWGPGFQGELVRVKSSSSKTVEANDQVHVPSAGLEKGELEAWLVARKALMVCREIVRTERSYREGLIKLQRGETMKPPPPLLLRYLPALISASQVFSARIDDDPSTYGVSVAFFATEDVLEAALVAWSGIVGEFFGAPTRKQRKRLTTDLGLEMQKKGKGKNKKDMMVGAPVLPPVTSSDAGHTRDQSAHVETRNDPGHRRKSMPTLSHIFPSSTETSPVHRKSWYFPSSTASNPAKLPTVQDLAIQPTQRVMRYVLLYKDLLNSTPTLSPARGLVERALEGANRIAQRCNRAQDNAAFLT